MLRLVLRLRGRLLGEAGARRRKCRKGHRRCKSMLRYLWDWCCRLGRYKLSCLRRWKNRLHWRRENRLRGRSSDRGGDRRCRRGSDLLRFLLLNRWRRRKRREWLCGLLWGWLLFNYGRFDGHGLDDVSTKTQTSKLHAYFVQARSETSRQRHDNSLIDALVLATNRGPRRKRYRRFGPSRRILLLNLGRKS